MKLTGNSIILELKKGGVHGHPWMDAGPQGACGPAVVSPCFQGTSDPLSGTYASLLSYRVMWSGERQHFPGWFSESFLFINSKEADPQL